MECRDGEDFEVELGVNEVIWRFLVFEGEALLGPDLLC